MTRILYLCHKMNELNFKLPFIPVRSDKPRNQGLTMMMDKGLGLRETEDFIEASAHLTDIVKFGFGTSSGFFSKSYH